MGSIVPSAQREVHVSVPRVTWDDIGGLAEGKRVLIEAIEWPLRHRGMAFTNSFRHTAPYFVSHFFFLNFYLTSNTQRDCSLEAFQRLGIAASRGVLLHGPPGCSKTTLVKAAANYAKASFLTFSGAAIFAPYLGAAEAIIRGAFKKVRLSLSCWCS